MKEFMDRYEAGKILAEQLKSYSKKDNTIVLALPRGGVPVAYEIAKLLSLPLDVFIVRKLGVPGHEELAMGAIATGNITVFNDEIVRDFAISTSAIDEVIQSEKIELQRRNSTYRNDKPLPVFENKNIILVDDGIATGATMKAAIKALKQQKPAKIIIAIPVAAFSTCEELEKSVDELVCLLKPHDFYAVGVWYENFSQTTDEEVFELLKNLN